MSNTQYEPQSEVILFKIVNIYLLYTFIIIHIYRYLFYIFFLNYLIFQAKSWMKNVFITPLESSIWFYLIQKRSSLDFLNFHFLSFLQIYYKSGISHQAISPSLFFFKIKAFFLKFFIQNPFDVSNFERIKEDDLSKIPDENSGWDAEFWEKKSTSSSP